MEGRAAGHAAAIVRGCDCQKGGDHINLIPALNEQGAPDSGSATSPGSWVITHRRRLHRTSSGGRSSR
jgi:hypothetical protein